MRRLARVWLIILPLVTLGCPVFETDRMGGGVSLGGFVDQIPTTTPSPLPSISPSPSQTPTPVPSSTPSQTPSPVPSLAPSPAPTISQVTPNWGLTSGGTVITVSGSVFVTGVTVMVGGAACTPVNVVSSSILTCTTSAGAESPVTGDSVTVTNPGGQSASGGSFHYVKLPNEVGSESLKVWLKADALALSDGGSVTTWTDSSGLANNAYQGSTSKRPILRTNQLNGKPVVRFDGTNDVMSISSTNASSNFSLLMVVARLATTSDMHIIEPDCLSSCEWIFLSGQSVFAWDGQAVISQSFNTMAFNIINLDRSATVGSVRINGGAPVSGTVPTARGAQLIIGRRNVDSSEYLMGDIAEIILYGLTLSDTDRQSIEKYLNVKYGLGVL